LIGLEAAMVPLVVPPEVMMHDNLRILHVDTSSMFVTQINNIGGRDRKLSICRKARGDEKVSPRSDR
jgi:hypothetical protein